MTDLNVASHRVALVLALCVSAHVATAQAPTGGIHGTVTDVDNNVVAGATIEMRSATTGAVYRATSGQKGEYAIRVPDGVYNLSVTGVAGFRAYEQQDVTVQQAKLRQLDLRLADDITLNTLGEDRASRA